MEYSCAVLEELRKSAVEGLLRFGHGGLEIGGALFGSRGNGAVRILACAELACEHAHGPGFALSGDDRARFRKLLAEAPAGMEPVGWYGSHTRSGLALNENDRRVFGEFFPKPGAIAVVLRPSGMGSARAAFFYREEGGELCAPGEGDEITVPAPRRRTRPEIVPERRGTLPSASPPVPVPFDAAARASGDRTVWPYAAAVAAVALVFLPAIAFLPRPGPPHLGLHARGVAPGQIRIDWDRRSSAVLAASSGVLEIQDGASRVRLPLNGDQLRSSSVTYALDSGDALIHLHVASTDESLHFRGAPARPALAVAAPAVAVAAPPGVAVRDRDSEPPPRPAEKAAAREQPAPPPVVRRLAVVPAPAAPAPEALPALPPPPPVAPERADAELPFSAPMHVPVAPPPAARSTPAPRSGRLIWTGSLERRGVVEIDGGHPSVGSMIGALPGVPVSFRVSPAQFDAGGLVVHSADAAWNGRAEPATAANGWNRLEFEWDPERAREIAAR
ncbi:MAG: hypothetical protein LAQ30_09020 [Acidobacteriia bacterium]|nr:hypothetical protein [Terriglobia bacterium]